MASSVRRLFQSPAGISKTKLGLESVFRNESLSPFPVWAGRSFCTFDKQRAATAPPPRKDDGDDGNVEEEEEDGDDVNEEGLHKDPVTGEIGGPRGPEPTRFGDWEIKGRCSDF